MGKGRSEGAKLLSANSLLIFILILILILNLNVNLNVILILNHQPPPAAAPETAFPKFEIRNPKFPQPNPNPKPSTTPRCHAGDSISQIQNPKSEIP